MRCPTSSIASSHHRWIWIGTTQHSRRCGMSGARESGWRCRGGKRKTARGSGGSGSREYCNCGAGRGGGFAAFGALIGSGAEVVAAGGAETGPALFGLTTSHDQPKENRKAENKSQEPDWHAYSAPADFGHLIKHVFQGELLPSDESVGDVFRRGLLQPGKAQRGGIGQIKRRAGE